MNSNSIMGLIIAIVLELRKQIANCRAATSIIINKQLLLLSILPGQTARKTLSFTINTFPLFKKHAKMDTNQFHNYFSPDLNSLVT